MWTSLWYAEKSTPSVWQQLCLTSMSLQSCIVSFYNGCQAKTYRGNIHAVLPRSMTDLSPTLYYVGLRKGKAIVEPTSHKWSSVSLLLHCWEYEMWWLYRIAGFSTKHNYLALSDNYWTPEQHTITTLYDVTARVNDCKQAVLKRLLPAMWACEPTSCGQSVSHQLLPDPDTSVRSWVLSNTSLSAPCRISLTTPSSMSTSTACGFKYVSITSPLTPPPSFQSSSL